MPVLGLTKLCASTWFETKGCNRALKNIWQKKTQKQKKKGKISHTHKSEKDTFKKVLKVCNSVSL